MTNNPLGERASEIQEIVNDQQPLLSAVAEKKSNWSQFMSCIRAIQCTEYALEAYTAEISNQMPIEEGKAFLLIYGVFQALFTQQDAVINLCQALKSLNIDDLKDSDIEDTFDEIRQIRNDIGHPTDRHPSQKYPEMGRPFVQINSITPFANGVYLHIDFPERAEKNGSIAIFGFHNIEIPPLIKKQKTAIIRVLDDLLETLKKILCNCP